MITSETYRSQQSFTCQLEKLARWEQRLGRTPVRQLPSDNVELYAKVEYTNPTGSIKDRAAFAAISDGLKYGSIGPDTTIVESSSGNMGVALAGLANYLGLHFVPVIDANIVATNEMKLQWFCTRVEKITEPAAEGGMLGARLGRVVELIDEFEEPYVIYQYLNESCVNAHYFGTGAEIVSQVPDLDYVFVAVSSGGTLCGVAKRLKEDIPGVRVIAVDAEGSAVFCGQPRPRRIPGIGAGIVPPLIKRVEIDDVVIVSERDTVQGCIEMRDQFGLFVGGSSGSCYAAIKQYFSSYRSRVRPKVMFLCPDSGIGYSDTVYNPDWSRSTHSDSLNAS